MPRSDIAESEEAIVLYVSPDEADMRSLERMFHGSGWSGHTNSEWTLIARPTLDVAATVLQEVEVSIVICESVLGPNTWREMLECLSLLPDPPLLIVTSRLADERLWAEALNLGAHDVLVKPFDPAEVIRIVSFAWQHWQERHHLAIRR